MAQIIVYQFLLIVCAGALWSFSHFFLNINTYVELFAVFIFTLAGELFGKKIRQVIKAESMQQSSTNAKVPLFLRIFFMANGVLWMFLALFDFFGVMLLLNKGITAPSLFVPAFAFGTISMIIGIGMYTLQKWTLPIFGIFFSMNIITLLTQGFDLATLSPLLYGGILFFFGYLYRSFFAGQWIHYSFHGLCAAFFALLAVFTFWPALLSPVSDADVNAFINETRWEMLGSPVVFESFRAYGKLNDSETLLFQRAVLQEPNFKETMRTSLEIRRAVRVMLETMTSDERKEFQQLFFTDERLNTQTQKENISVSPVFDPRESVLSAFSIDPKVASSIKIFEQRENEERDLLLSSVSPETIRRNGRSKTLLAISTEDTIEVYLYAPNETASNEVYDFEYYNSNFENSQGFEGDYHLVSMRNGIILSSQFIGKTNFGKNRIDTAIQTTIEPFTRQPLLLFYFRSGSDNIKSFFYRVDEKGRFYSVLFVNPIGKEGYYPYDDFILHSIGDPTKLQQLNNKSVAWCVAYPGSEYTCRAFRYNGEHFIQIMDE